MTVYCEVERPTAGVLVACRAIAGLSIMPAAQKGTCKVSLIYGVGVQAFREYESFLPPRAAWSLTGAVALLRKLSSNFSNLQCSVVVFP